jgi:hypothetical protein
MPAAVAEIAVEAGVGGAGGVADSRPDVPHSRCVNIAMFKI